MSIGLGNLLLQAVKKPSQILRRDYLELEHLQGTKNNARFLSNAVSRTKELLQEFFGIKEKSKVLFLDDPLMSHWDAYDTVCMIDPLEGAGNFVHSIPFFGIAIFLRRKSEYGTSSACIIDFPALNETYYSATNEGVRFLQYFPKQQISKLYLKHSINHKEAKNLYIVSEDLTLASGLYPDVNNNFLSFGSNLFSFSYLMRRKIDVLVTSSSNIVTNQVLKLFIQEYNGSLKIGHKYTIFSNHVINEM